MDPLLYDHQSNQPHHLRGCQTPMSTPPNNPAQAAPASVVQIKQRLCGSCGADVPPEFEEGQGEPLPCGH